MALPARRFDVDAFKASLRPGVAYREGYSSSTTVTLLHEENQYYEFNVRVLMQYNGAEIPIGRIIVITRLTQGLMHIDMFDNYFRTKPRLARLHAECFPHVVTSGVLTSALYWLIQSLVPARADARVLTLTLHASSLLTDTDESGQARLEAHYAMMGFACTVDEGNPFEFYDMSTTVANFLRSTRDFATITFIFAPNALHPMSTRNRLM